MPAPTPVAVTQIRLVAVRIPAMPGGDGHDDGFTRSPQDLTSASMLCSEHGGTLEVRRRGGVAGSEAATPGDVAMRGGEVLT
jgi:hypothetical protein